MLFKSGWFPAYQNVLKYNGLSRKKLFGSQSLEPVLEVNHQKGV